MIKRLLPLVLLVLSCNVFAQEKNSVSDFFISKIDSMIASSAANDATAGGYISSNPVYVKMMASPVLYSSVINRGFTEGFGYENVLPNSLGADQKRSAVIDAMLMNMYKNHPTGVQLTEEQLRSEAPVADVSREAPLKIELEQFVSPVMPDNVTGGLKTTINKPNYWRTSGSFDLKFTQNYVSPNWSQGGENTRTLLALLVLNLNYDDKDKITFTNRFDASLGFSTVEADTLHSIKTNNDKIRLESTLGYKITKNLDVAVKSKLETQLLPNYPTNSPDFVSKFLAPFDGYFSMGFNYKPVWDNFRVEIYVAPLSAFNYRFVRYGHLASRYGIEEGSHHRKDYGTQIVVTVPSATLFKLVNWWSRAEYYTNYDRAFFSWENKFDIKLNRYFSVSMLVHTRFDDSALHLDDDKYGFWQIKEYMMLGLSYSW